MKLPSVKILLKSLTSNKSILEQKGKYLSSIRIFPFFHLIFLLLWNKQEIFKRRHEKDQKCFPVNFAKFPRAPFSNKTPPVAASEKWTIVKPITLQRTFFTQVTGNRVSDHYARNIYVKVFLEIAVLWMLVPSKILHQNNKIIRKYLQ